MDEERPAGFWRRWQETEPLRLYLYGITVPLLGVALVSGWLTERQMGAWLAVAGALFIGSTVAGELARRQVTPVHGPVLAGWLAEQDDESYTQGVQDALHQSPERVAAAITPTAQMSAVRPSARCREVVNGRRCVLDAHDEETPHHYA